MHEPTSGGTGMKKVSFIMKAWFICLGVILFSLVPLPVLTDSNNVVVVKADEVKGKIKHAKGKRLTEREIKLNVSTKALVKDSSYTLSLYNTEDGQKVTFKSDNSSIVSVEYENGSRKCVITGNKVGTAIVTVTVKEGSGFLAKTIKTLTCEVTVGPPALSIKFLQESIKVKEGNRINLAGKLEIKPGNSTEVPRYTVKNEEIGTISASGYFKAKAPGKTLVTAEINNGLSANITIIVTKEEETETKAEKNEKENSSKEESKL